jgi:hypothetical protein
MRVGAYDGQAAPEIQFEEIAEPLPNDTPCVLIGQGGIGNAGVPLHRILLEVGDAFVGRKQDPSFGESRFDDDRVLGSAKPLVAYRAGVVAQVAKVCCQFDRQVFVYLELHDALIGAKRSSWANSAAYAKAA